MVEFVSFEFKCAMKPRSHVPGGLKGMVLDLSLT